MEWVPVHVSALTDAPGDASRYILVLEETERYRRLPITLGQPEAQAIAMAVQSRELPRPATHDLFVDTLQKAGIELQRVRITHLEDGAFCAQLSFRKKGEEPFSCDARTSDAIALAIRVFCPVEVAKELMDEHGILSNRMTENTVWLKGSLDDYSRPELEELLEQALQREDYQAASRIRDALEGME